MDLLVLEVNSCKVLIYIVEVLSVDIFRYGMKSAIKSKVKQSFTQIVSSESY